MLKINIKKVCDNIIISSKNDLILLTFSYKTNKKIILICNILSF